jgi:hypothetical protein
MHRVFGQTAVLAQIIPVALKKPVIKETNPSPAQSKNVNRYPVNSLFIVSPMLARTPRSLQTNRDVVAAPSQHHESPRSGIFRIQKTLYQLPYAPGQAAYFR